MEGRCVQCLLDKYLVLVPEGTSKREVLSYQEQVREIVKEVSSRREGSAPEAASIIEALYQKCFEREPISYGEIKRHFNGLLLSCEEKLREEILGAKDPLRQAVSLAMMGNYIDFAALSDVSEERLWELLGEAGNLVLPFVSNCE